MYQLGCRGRQRQGKCSYHQTLIILVESPAPLQWHCLDAGHTMPMHVGVHTRAGFIQLCCSHLFFNNSSSMHGLHTQPLPGTCTQATQFARRPTYVSRWWCQSREAAVEISLSTTREEGLPLDPRQKYPSANFCTHHMFVGVNTYSALETPDRICTVASMCPSEMIKQISSNTCAPTSKQMHCLSQDFPLG